MDIIIAILPPLIAIVLALVTKEVYSSLMVGILAGAFFFANFNPLVAFETTFTIMADKIGGNAKIILFLCFLGILVVLMTKAGGSRAYGAWAAKNIKSRKGAMLATSALGAIIFVDDYFNCLTVGTVMMPVTDNERISRAKLAYIIDATAAPVCIIAPVSSWAVSVSSNIADAGIENAFGVFMQTIPYNLYAILTLVMLVLITIFSIDYGKMAKHEQRALETGDVAATGEAIDVEKEVGFEISEKGRVFDLILPVLFLIFSSVGFMIYTGHNACVADGVTANLINIFGACDSSLSLVLGSFVTILFALLLYLPRKIMTFKEFMKSMAEGCKSMIPAVMILTLAWTLSGICGSDYLQTGEHVGKLVQDSGLGLEILPAIIFLVASFLSFSMGTSWGTFGILIPIVVIIFKGEMSTLLVISLAATLAGSVFGDHISPISDTTILASTGASCDHIQHVSTQLEYAAPVAACCFVTYLLAGFIQNAILTVLIGIALLVVTLFVIRFIAKKKGAKAVSVVEEE